MNGLYAFTIIFCVYAVGDIIAQKTKAIVSMMLVASVFFLVAFMNGLPASIFEDSSLQGLANVGVGLLLVNMGTTIELKDLVQEWKTVALVICSSLGLCLGAYLLGGLLINQDYVLMGTPVLGGGIVAYLIMAEALTGQVGGNILAFGSLLLACHTMVGIPLASVFCKKEARRLHGEFQSNRLEIPETTRSGNGEVEKPRGLAKIFMRFRSDNYLIAKTALIACLSSVLSNFTGGKVNLLIICLILGIVAREIGFLEKSPLDLSKSSALILGATLVNAFSSLSGLTLEMIVSMIRPLLTMLAIGIVSCGIVAILVGRFLKVSWYMSFALGLSAMIGFPATMLVSAEVCKAVAESPEEEGVLLQNVQPKMIIVGMVSVSIISVAVASFLVSFL